MFSSLLLVCHHFSTKLLPALNHHICQAEHYENIQEPTFVGKETEMTPEHKCVVQGCVSTFKLKSLVRRKLRGGGHKVWDCESTMLVITYFRLDKIGDPFEAYICNHHWRNWYRYNYKIKQALCFYVDDAKEQKSVFKSH